MNKLTKKQKIIAIMIIIFLTGSYLYYSYTKGVSEFIEDDVDIMGIAEDSEQGQELAKESKIKIHILGAVNQSGMLELDEGSRIADAIEKAGGCSENACVDEINLAYILEDGMKIKIPTYQEVAESKKLAKDAGYEESLGNSLDNSVFDSKEVTSLSSSASNSKEVTSTSSSLNSEASNSKGQKININSASVTELQKLPGVGSSTAEKIIAYRKENGKFKVISDLKNVKGIGESKFNKLKDFITV